MSGLLQLESRSLYTYWDLLSDFGGFYAGCFMICSIFKSTYAALAFQADYIDGSHNESVYDKRVRSIESGDRFSELLTKFNEGD